MLEESQSLSELRKQCKSRRIQQGHCVDMRVQRGVEDMLYRTEPNRTGMIFLKPVNDIGRVLIRSTGSIGPHAYFAERRQVR